MRINGVQHANYFLNLAIQKDIGRHFSAVITLNDLLNSCGYGTSLRGFNQEGLYYSLKDHYDSSVPTFLLHIRYAFNSYNRRTLGRTYETED